MTVAGTDNRKYAIYSRKSKFTGKGESIENQIEICRDTLKKLYQADNDMIVVYEDEGFTGANTRRPMFQKMMKDCRTGEIKAVICYRLDRISRNTGDFVQTYNELKNLGVKFLSVSEQIDDDNPLGKAMIMLSSIFAQLERDIIAERINDNMIELAKTGRWLGGITPTGYKSVETVGSVTVDGKERKAHRLEQIPEEIKLVKTIYSKFLELRSLTKVETYLLQRTVKTKNSNDFTRFAVKAVLQKPVYAIADSESWKYFKAKGMQVFAEESDFDGRHGVMSYNKTKQQAGRAAKPKDDSEWIIAVGKHKGVISGRKWVEVQRLLEQNRSKAYRKPRSNTALLSGVLFCKQCGSYMRPKLTQRLNKEGELIYNYMCEMREKSKGRRCDVKWAKGNELDKLLIEEIKKLGADNSELMKLLKKDRRDLSETYADYQGEIERLEREKKENDKASEKLIGLLTSAGDTPAAEMMIDKINELKLKNQETDKTIAEYQRLISQRGMTDSSYETLADMLSDFAKTADTLTVQQKRDLIRCLVRRVEWDGENADIYIIGSEYRSAEADSLSPQRENSKRDTDALSGAAKDRRRGTL